MQGLHLFGGIRNRLSGRDEAWRILQGQRRRVTQPEDSTPTKTKRWHLSLGPASRQIHPTWETPGPASHRIHPTWEAPGQSALDLENRKQKGGLHLLDQLAVGSTLPGKLRSANKTRPSRQVFTFVQRKGAVERINEHQRAIAENDKSFWRWWQAQEGGTVLTLKKHRTTFGMWVVSSIKSLCFSMDSSCRGPCYFKVLKIPPYILEMVYSDSGFQPHRLTIFLWNKVSIWRNDALNLELPVPMKSMANFMLRSISLTVKTST